MERTDETINTVTFAKSWFVQREIHAAKKSGELQRFPLTSKLAVGLSAVCIEANAEVSRFTRLLIIADSVIQEFKAVALRWSMRTSGPSNRGPQRVWALANIQLQRAFANLDTRTNNQVNSQYVTPATAAAESRTITYGLLESAQHGQEARIQVRTHRTRCTRRNIEAVAAQEGGKANSLPAVVTRRAAATSSPSAAPTARDAPPRTRRSRDSPSATWSSPPPSVRSTSISSTPYETIQSAYLQRSRTTTVQRMLSSPRAS